VSAALSNNLVNEDESLRFDAANNELHTDGRSPPPQYPAFEAPPIRPLHFSYFFSSTDVVSSADNNCQSLRSYPSAVTASSSAAAPAYAPLASGETSLLQTPRVFDETVAETKQPLPPDTKAQSSTKGDESEPPPAYSEGSSPLLSFTYLMAAAGGASSIITQVQQGGAPITTIGGKTRWTHLAFSLHANWYKSYRCWCGRDNCDGPSVGARYFQYGIF
jgi:hypothetical protein